MDMLYMVKKNPVLYLLLEKGGMREKVAMAAFVATTIVELREVRQWQSISPTIRKAWVAEEEGTGRPAGRVTKKSGK